MFGPACMYLDQFQDPQVNGLANLQWLQGFECLSSWNSNIRLLGVGTSLLVAFSIWPNPLGSGVQLSYQKTDAKRYLFDSVA